MFKKNKDELFDHYRDHNYINARIDSENQFPEDIFLQLEYLKKTYGPKFHVMRMAEATQESMSTTQKEIELSPMLIEYMMRGYMDALAHMEKELPEGIYTYIQNKSDTFFYECIEHGTGLKSLTNRNN